jgi:hypothetical protein
MNDYSPLIEQVAAEQIRERVANKQRSALVARHHGSGRHKVANRLHSLANRLDS